MKLSSKTIALFAAVAVVFGLSLAAAQNPSGDTAKDPVCGMDVKKAEAKAAFDYKGTTYHFCSAGCKDEFARDPEKHLQKESGKAECACPHCGSEVSGMQGKCPQCGRDLARPEADMSSGCPMMQAGMVMKQGQKAGAMGMSCPLAGLMHDRDIALRVENVKDGVQVIISSKKAETVKKLQEAAAKMKAHGESKDCGDDCLDK